MKYVTKDGREFDTLKEAKAHEKTLKPSPRARSTAALDQDMVRLVLLHPHGDLAAQVITLSNQIRARRKCYSAEEEARLEAAASEILKSRNCAAEQDFPL